MCTVWWFWQMYIYQCNPHPPKIQNISTIHVVVGLAFIFLYKLWNYLSSSWWHCSPLQHIHSNKTLVKFILGIILSLNAISQRTEIFMIVRLCNKEHGICSDLTLQPLIQLWVEFCTPLKISWSPNCHYLRIWPYLETELLQM